MVALRASSEITSRHVRILYPVSGTKEVLYCPTSVVVTRIADDKVIQEVFTHGIISKFTPLLLSVQLEEQVVRKPLQRKFYGEMEKKRESYLKALNIFSKAIVSKASFGDV